MRALVLAAVAAAVGGGGCAADDDEDELTPSLAFQYDTIEGANAVVALADERCDETGGDAWLLESDREPTGYRVIFVCR